MTLGGRERIFGEASVEKRFSRVFMRSVRRVGVEGIYGSHSLRKGAGSYAAEFSPSGPTLAAVCYRGAWSLGVESRYLRHEKAGDQHVGRMLSGLNPHDESFAVLPPVFKRKHWGVAGALLRGCFSGFNEASREFRMVLVMTLASVVYHREWLKREVIGKVANHPLGKLDFFDGDEFEGVKYSELTEIPVWRRGSRMKPTGVPPQVILMRKIRKLKERVNARMGVSERRMIEGETKFFKGIEKKMTNVIIAGIFELRRGGRGRREISEGEEEEEEEEKEEEEAMRRIKRRIKMLERIDDEEEGREGEGEERSEEEEEEEEEDDDDDDEEERNYLERRRKRRRIEIEEEDDDYEEEVNEEMIRRRRNRRREIERREKVSEVHSRDGRLTRIPDDYTLSGVKLGEGWKRYFCGEERRKVPALREVSNGEMPKKVRKVFGRYVRLMEGIIEEAKREGVWMREPESRSEANELLGKIDVGRIISSRTEKDRERRIGELSVVTLANGYCKEHPIGRRNKEKEGNDSVVGSNGNGNGNIRRSNNCRNRGEEEVVEVEDSMRDEEEEGEEQEEDNVLEMSGDDDDDD